MRRPPYQRSLGAAGGQPSARTAGANSGSTRVPGPKKIIFPKIVPRPLGMVKQFFLARFEPVVARFGPWKIPNCLENRPFWDQKLVKNGSKKHFSKSDTGSFGMLKQVFLAHFEAVMTRFGPWKIQKCLDKTKINRANNPTSESGVRPEISLLHYSSIRGRLKSFSRCCFAYWFY